MLIQKLATMFRSIVFGLLGWINLPKAEFLDEVKEFLLGVVDTGSSLVLFFVPSSTIKIALGITATLCVFKYGYYLVIWIMKKIPVASVS
jgi:hypothetical protein